MSSETKYDPEWIANFYDEYGEREWLRLMDAPIDRVSYLVHSYYLREFIKQGSRVLEIGAGPGRFTKVLAELECRVVVGDISRVQLELHRKYAAVEGFSDCVESRLEMDVSDLSAIESSSFDAVVCYGGPLSYVFERAETALRERYRCSRVCSSSGYVLASVMALWGGFHRHLHSILKLPMGSTRKPIRTGDLIPENWVKAKHFCHLFRSQELKRLLEKSDLKIVSMSACNCLSVNYDDMLSDFEPDSEEWAELVEMEIEASKEPGCLDVGTHIIAVAQPERTEQV